MSHTVRWTAKKISRRLELIEPLVYRRTQEIGPFHYRVLPDAAQVPSLERDVDVSDWERVENDSYWGELHTNFVMRGEFQIPADWNPHAPVALFLPLGKLRDFSHPEALVYVDGKPFGTTDRHHQEIILSEAWRDGQPHQLVMHGWTGGGLTMKGRPYVDTCAIVQVDVPTRDFLATARVALGVAEVLDDTVPAKDRLLNALDAALGVLDIRIPHGEGFYESVPEAHRILREGIAKAGPALDVSVSAVGHAHIDVAWLWTLDQTRRKTGRTFHTVLRNMEQFPQYHFTQSQPQLYDYVRQDYPELFESIKRRVAEGRWEIIGGMWVEADCNVSGSESLARQFLLGRSFFREHFGEGAESSVLWLPDVFGYAWALPQLIRDAGLEYFFTIKIGWNQYNKLPYDSFWWQGLDGSRVLTHFSTAPEGDLYSIATYNADATPKTVLGTWYNFKHKEAQDNLLMAYGHGDGGGGPTREMIENLREMADFPATPRTVTGKVIDFFREMDEKSGDKLPTWNGELYLELHRGTYTTQGANKRANRKSEFLLHDAEFLAAMAHLVDPEYEYPGETFQKAWELVCLNQFHDIIPGSSIREVYVESLQQYAQITRMGLEARAAALQSIGAKIGGDILLANTTGFDRSDLTFWPEQLPSGQYLIRADGVPVFTQNIEGGMWVAAGKLPPVSVTALLVAEGNPPVANQGLIATDRRLENAFLRVEFNGAGDITRIYDKVAGREVLPEGAVANQLQAFEDNPMNWDAWDIDIFYEDKMWLAEPADAMRVVEAGPLRATLEVRRRILNSSFTQRVTLVYNSPRLDFDTHFDWHERKILLKAAFPVDVLAPAATYEIQWGNVERPTHRNTSWDWARFETVAQKWVDLSEGDYGVSLLNDCKYGHDIRDNVLRISLLRGTTSPDGEADQGEHRFAYSLLPHAGAWDEQTIAQAYAFNDPIVATKGSGWQIAAAPDAVKGLLSIDRANIVLETVKRAEDGNGIIVRFYESRRQRGPVTLKPGFPLAGVFRANILEENQEALALNEDGSVTVNVAPYKIVTLRLIPA